jgi:hypothetical protein
MVGGGCLQQGNGKQKSWEVFCQGQLSNLFCNHFGMVVEFMVDQKGGTARCTHEKNTSIPGHVLNEGVGSCKTFTCGVRFELRFENVCAEDTKSLNFEAEAENWKWP